MRMCHSQTSDLRDKREVQNKKLDRKGDIFEVVFTKLNDPNSLFFQELYELFDFLSTTIIN